MNEIEVPTYEQALERHETPLDIFVSRWEPAQRSGEKKNFRADLRALIDYIAMISKGNNGERDRS